MRDVLYICYQFPRLSETFIYNEFLALRRSGLRVRALAMSPADPSDLAAEMLPPSEEALCLPRPGLWLGLADLRWALLRHPLRASRALLWLARGEAPLHRWFAYVSHLLYACHVARHADLSGVAVLHAHFATGPASVAMFLGLLTDRPYTVVAHAYDIYQDRMALGLKVETAAAFVTISKENRAWLVGRYGDAASRVRVIHCGVDVRELSECAARSTRTCPPLIVAVGRLTPKKGHDTLIRACDLLRTKGVSFGCAIVGAGEQDGELRDLVESLDLSNEVRLLGPLPHSETLALAARASVAALACRALPDGARDGIPVSLMESMAMGIPVVSTRVSGIPELVQDGQNGVLVDQDDPAAFADALAQVLLDEEWRKVLGPAARRTVERQFDLAKTTGRMRSLLESVAPELVDRAPGDG